MLCYYMNCCERPQPPLNSSECRRECSESLSVCYYTSSDGHTLSLYAATCWQKKREKERREISTMFLMFVECAKAIKQKPILHSSRIAHKHVPAAVFFGTHMKRERLSKCALVLSLFYFLGIYRAQTKYIYIHLCKLYRKECGYKQTPFFSIYFRNNFAQSFY
jgi:hypothetical protein